MEDVRYILAVAFQLAGAILLLVKYFTNSSKRLLKEKQEQKITYDKEKSTLIIPNGVIKSSEFSDSTDSTDKEFVTELWLSRCAFSYIVLGYLFGIWGNLERIDRCWATVYIIAISVILIAVGEFIASIKSKKFKSQ